MDKVQLEIDRKYWMKKKESELGQDIRVFGYHLYDLARAHKWYDILEDWNAFSFICDSNLTSKGFEFLYDNNYAHPGQTFLDMGSGQGFQVMGAAKAGLKAYGIELKPLRTIVSRQLIKEVYKKNMLPVNSICKVVNSTYLTPEYINFRNSGKSIAPALEPDSSRYEYKDEYLKIVGSNNAYNKLGIKPSEVDVFFLYNEMFAFYSAAEFISMNAKPGAIFFTRLGLWDEKHYDFANSLGLEVVGNFYSTYIPDDDSWSSSGHTIFLKKNEKI